MNINIIPIKRHTIPRIINIPSGEVINDPKSNANHKKKQKKKKKSKKSSKEVNNIIIAGKNENNNNNIDEDEDIADFKKCIEDFTTHNNRFLYQNKIEPSISKAFIKRLENN